MSGGPSDGAHDAAVTKEAAVMDASAVIAWLREEPGGERVGERLTGSFVSAINLSEVLQKRLAAGAIDRSGVAGLAADLVSLGLSVVPFGTPEAATAAKLWDATPRHLGLGFADRACMATAVGLGLPALTADRPWAEVEWEGLIVEVIR